jgi:hypothetical protein
MPARASEPSPATTSRRARAPRAWPRAPGAIPRPSWLGCTPITPRVLTRSVFAAPAAAPPLRSDRGGASRRRLRRPAYGGHPTSRRGRPGAARHPQAAGAVCARALRPPLLSRDDPDSPAPPQAVVEESQEAAGTGQPRAAGGLCRTAPGLAGRRHCVARVGVADAPAPTPFRGHAMRTDSGRPSSSMRLSAWTPTLTSVTRRRSVRACSPSPITRLYREMAASARARAL